MWIRTLWLVLVAGCMDIATLDQTDGVDSADITITAPPTPGLPDPLCTTCDAFTASGRAYGMTIAMRNLVIVPPTPDTSVTGAAGAAQQTKLPPNLPFGVPSPSATAFFVSDVDALDPSSATDAAAAMTDQITVSSPNLAVYATGLRAVTTSTASRGGASASTAGSLIQYLRVNGQDYQNLDAPRIITIREHGDHGGLLGEVRVLETSYDTSTPGATSCQVNALHIIIPGHDGNSELVIAHAESASAITDRLPP